MRVEAVDHTEKVGLSDFDSEADFEPLDVFDSTPGLSRYRDPVTQSLGLLASTWESADKSWQQAEKRARVAPPGSPTALFLATYREECRTLRDAIGERLAKTLRQHALYPWLTAHRGCPKAVHTARVIAMVKDPLLFPGRQCPAGHYSPADHEGMCLEQVQVGEGKAAKWVTCNAEVEAVRRGTGTRALWHYLGLHVVDGALPKRAKGQQADWSTKGRTACLMPDGIADMIIRQKVEPWYGVYLAAKAWKVGRANEVEDETISVGPAAGHVSVIVSQVDSVIGEGGETEAGYESAVAHGLSASALPPWHIHKIGRIVLVKAFVADMLAEWKRIVLEMKEV